MISGGWFSREEEKKKTQVQRGNEDEISYTKTYRFKINVGHTRKECTGLKTRKQL